MQTRRLVPLEVPAMGLGCMGMSDFPAGAVAGARYPDMSAVDR